MQHVADGRTRRRGDEADALRKLRQRTFAFWREQTFRRELLFQFFKLDLQRADALQFHGAHDHLVLAARFVNRHVALQQNFLAIRQQLAEPGESEDAEELDEVLLSELCNYKCEINFRRRETE